MTKQISGDQLQYLIEDYLLTLDDAENEEFCVSAREHARREVSGFVEWLNKRTADEPRTLLPTYEESRTAVESSDATPLQTFIYHYEPTLCDRHFRGALAAAIGFSENRGEKP